jgi:hypothetical protein
LNNIQPSPGQNHQLASNSSSSNMLYNIQLTPNLSNIQLTPSSHLSSLQLTPSSQLMTPGQQLANIQFPPGTVLTLDTGQVLDWSQVRFL